MHSISDYIASGFSLANQRFHWVILDMLAKMAWLAATVALVGLAVTWFASRVLLTGPEVTRLGSDVPGIRFLEALHLLATRWDELAWALFLATVLSAFSWVLLEAFLRAGMLPMTNRGFLNNAIAHFGTFLVSGLIRRIAFISVAALVILRMRGPLLTAPVGQWAQLWPNVSWPAARGLASLLVVSFLLMAFEALIHTGTLDYLRSDFVSIIKTIGYVTLIEFGLILGAAAPVIVLIGVGESPGLGVLLAGIVLAGASGIHSYLLLVRYFALGIMRREKPKTNVLQDVTTL